MTAEFSFLSAGTPADWDRWSARNVAVGDEGVSLATELAFESSLLGVSARDVDLNPNGNLCVLTPDGEIAVYVAATQRLTSLSLDGYARADITTPLGVGTTTYGIYVIDSDGSLTAFGRRRREYEWTIPCGTTPRRITGSNTRVYVLDAGDSDSDDEADTDAGGCIHAVDASGRRETVVEGLRSPIDIAVGADEDLYILGRTATGAVGVLRADEDVGRFDPPDVLPVELPEGFEPTGIAAHHTGEIVLSAVDGDATRLLRYDPATESATSLPDIEGAFRAPVGDTGSHTPKPGRLYLRRADGELRRLEERPTNRKDPASMRYEGAVIGRFDSGVRGMEWHRATLDLGAHPPGTRVDIAYYASECETEGVDDLSKFSPKQQRALAAAGIDGLWEFIEYTPAQLASGVGGLTISAAAELLQTARGFLEIEFATREEVTTVASPEDVLLVDAEGQYLHVEIRFIGTRQSAPELRAFRAYCPRQSYLRYLPEVYREQDRRSPFLSRFLSIFESVFVDIEETLRGDTSYLDPQEIPVDYLSWLTEWLAVDLGETWPESARRELLERAPELYKTRGTKRGLEAFAELYFRHVETPERPWESTLVRLERRLETLFEQGYLTSREAAETFAAYQAMADRDLPTQLGFFEYADFDGMTNPDRRGHYLRQVGHPRQFVVLLHPDLPAEHAHAVEEIVEAEKPVYTDATVDRLAKRFHVEEGTYLGINTVLPNRQFDLGAAGLGQQTTI